MKRLSLEAFVAQESFCTRILCVDISLDDLPTQRAAACHHPVIQLAAQPLMPPGRVDQDIEFYSLGIGRQPDQCRADQDGRVARIRDYPAIQAGIMAGEGS
jgi:hypothetical protein